MKIYITIGLPASGKSTWTKKRKLPYISSDEIRNQIFGIQFDQAYEKYVWRTVYKMIGFAIAAKSDFIIDATNLNEMYRNEMIDYIRAVRDDVIIIAVAFKTSAQTCIERDAKRNIGQVGESVIRMFEIDYIRFWKTDIEKRNEFDGWLIV